MRDYKQIAITALVFNVGNRINTIRYGVKKLSFISNQPQLLNRKEIAKNVFSKLLLSKIGTPEMILSG